MKPLLRPPCLRPGDTVAAVSLSWGGAGDAEILHRYQLGKRRLESLFGLKVIEMPHTLAGTEYLRAHPERRAQDLMDAFADTSVRGIISCIGGDDSLRLLPYIDYDIIRRNPKLYSGYSDSTVTHFMCYRAGVSSLYGPAILSDFAEYGALPAYSEKWVRKTWFNPAAPGEIEASPDFTGDRLEWREENTGKTRAFYPNAGYLALQGAGKARGPLIGGCLELLEALRGTPLFPEADDFGGAILFLETSEEKPPVWYLECFLHSLAAMDILPRLAGILFAKPMGGALQEEYHAAFRRILADYGLPRLPVLGNASFGHNEPKHPLPYGCLAEIDCDAAAFSLLEPATSAHSL